jgi:hypothetical protein
MNRIAVRGYVTIRQGDRILAERVRNHFVNAGLKGLISTLIFSFVYGSGSTWGNWYNDWNVYIGSDVSTDTNTEHTALESPIGAAPGTAPNSKSASLKNGAADGIWAATYLATWNAGTVSGTLGELALYMAAPDKDVFGWIIGTSSYYPAAVMVSRLSSKDTDFSSFIIDDTKPLTVEWTVQLAFA